MGNAQDRDAAAQPEGAGDAPKFRPTPPALEFVTYRVEEGIAYIMLNRPDKLNAMTYALVDQLEAVGDGADRRDHVMADAAAQKCRKVKITEKNRIAHHTPVKPVEPVSL